jgi:hypothetical protein
MHLGWDLVGLKASSSTVPRHSNNEVDIQAQQESERNKTRSCQIGSIFVVKVLDNLESRMASAVSSDSSSPTKEKELQTCIKVAVVHACTFFGHVLSIGMDPAFVSIGSQVLRRVIAVYPDILSLISGTPAETNQDHSTAVVDDEDGTLDNDDEVVVESNNGDIAGDEDDMWDSDAENEELAQVDIDLAFISVASDGTKSSNDMEISSRGRACVAALVCAYGECTECIHVVTSLSRKLTCFAPHVLTLLSDSDPMVARRGLLVTRRLCGSLHPVSPTAMGSPPHEVPKNAWAQYVALLSSVCSFMATCPDSRLRSSAHGCVMDVLNCISASQRMLALRTMSVSQSLSSPAKGLLLDAMKKVSLYEMKLSQSNCVYTNSS